jgi:hypothetical protein
MWNCASWWESISNEWFNNFDHVPCGFVKLYEHSIVYLSKSKKLQDFLWLWCKFVNTID